jgi:hypothetical protein
VAGRKNVIIRQDAGEPAGGPQILLDCGQDLLWQGGSHLAQAAPLEPADKPGLPTGPEEHEEEGVIALAEGRGVAADGVEEGGFFRASEVTGLFQICALGPGNAGDRVKARRAARIDGRSGRLHSAANRLEFRIELTMDGERMWVEMERK